MNTRKTGQGKRKRLSASPNELKLSGNAHKKRKIAQYTPAQVEPLPQTYDQEDSDSEQEDLPFNQIQEIQKYDNNTIHKNIEDLVVQEQLRMKSILAKKKADQVHACRGV